MLPVFRCDPVLVISLCPFASGLCLQAQFTKSYALSLTRAQPLEKISNITSPLLFRKGQHCGSKVPDL